MYIQWYGIYLIVSLAVIIILNWKNKRNIALKMIVVTFLPVVGWVLPMVWSRIRSEDSSKEFNDYIERQQEEHKVRRIGIYNEVEKYKELNVIPIEDALVVSEHQERRQVMIDVLKQDTINYIEILQRAVSNEDTETSHYAVSAIVELKRKLQISMQELTVKYENDQSNLHVVIAYVEVLREFMNSGFLDHRTLRKYQFTYLSVLNRLIVLAYETKWAYIAKVNMEIKLELYGDAEKTAQLFIENFPDNEDAYLSLLKVYFVTRSKQKLHLTLDKLKNSPVRLSNQALTTVRFWSEGA
ncbi:MAG: hypothetical protein NAG76_09240 [Candidatus Pristimantibacillus lignocellulolyticus]|uniref:Uncharacterized protein n=1 Tax=Candidatus Pristimantibacillus lignocellulolyticus TaxID=2994561 RepID=A0A9J6ZJP5_9BACL|nr:MAG: hypothetical protein NAG76_09240 [Candidatus Pristimantibacillus lignocellulolyticus]